MTDAASKENRAHATWLCALALFAPLSIMAELLITRTHHRPLGAATFASVAVLLWIFTEASLRRFLDPNLAGDRSRRGKVALGIGTALTAAVLVRAVL